jgi:hypothetical protein
MLSSKFLPFKSLSKLALTATLLLSLFAFSGFTTRSSSIPAEKNQTELVLSLKKGKVFSYQGIFAQSASPNNFSSSLETLSNLHQRIFKLRFDNSTFQFFAFKSIRSFLMQKTIPLNSDETSLLS